jgi:hypothetical protein
MELCAIALTGADDNVDPARLQELSKKFPLVEWGILSCEKVQGSSRFPTEAWVTDFHKACPSVRKALHLCGSDVDAFLALDPRVHAKVAKFDRVQLNFNHRRRPKNLEALTRAASSVSQVVILQHNSANAGLWAELRNRVTNLAILFDSSGGRGRSPDSGWPDMLPRTVCGFSGGLGPHNVAGELPTIAAIAGGAKFWLDMEGKLRSSVDDSFDLAACESVLRQAYAVYNPYHSGA